MTELQEPTKINTRTDMINARAAALKYLQLGFRVIEVPYQSKGTGAMEKGWVNLRITKEDIEEGRRFIQLTNIGILTGTTSNGLVDIDLDCDEAIALAPFFLPDTSMKSGRKSRPHSHWWYRCRDITQRVSLVDPDQKHGTQGIVEIRANNTMTVVPPSVHVSGEKTVWYETEGPTEVNRDQLEQSVRHLAAAVILTRLWTQHNRNDIALPLAGALVRSGWTAEEIEMLFRRVMTVAGDDEPNKRLKVIESTFTREAEGKSISSWPTLKGLPVVGERRGKVLQAYLAKFHDAEVTEVIFGTDDMIAQEFITEQAGSIKFTEDEGSWYIWQGGIWHRDPMAQRVKGKFFEFITHKVVEVASNTSLNYDAKMARVKSLTRYRHVKSVRDAIEAAECIDQKIWAARRDFDQQSTLINFRNGTYDIRDDSLGDHNPEDMLTQCLATEYDPLANCPWWESNLLRACSGNQDLVRYLQDAVGMSLLGLPGARAMFVIFGNKGTAKSMFLAVLQELLGSYAVTVPSEVLMRKVHFSSGPSPELAALAGKRFAFIDETDASHHFDEGVIKRLTGGGLITARNLYAAPFTFPMQAKFWIATNNLNAMAGDEKAALDRIHPIPFNNPVLAPSGNFNKVRDKYLEEAPGIMNWIIEGARRYLDTDVLIQPEVIRIERTVYEKDTDIFGQWFHAQYALTGNPNHWEWSEDLYAQFEAYCIAAGAKPPGAQRMGRYLQSVIGTTTELKWNNERRMRLKRHLGVARLKGE